MIIDGKKIAEEIKQDLKEKFSKLEFKPALAVVQIGDDPVTEKFVRSKQKFAEESGINFGIIKFPAEADPQAVFKKISELNEDEAVHGIVIQLPLPENFNTQKILDSVAVEKDIDVLSSAPNDLLPPVAGVVKEILDKYRVPSSGSRVVVIGQGRLVGKPAAEWFRKQGAEVTVIDKESWGTDLSADALANADIVVSGVGIPNLIKPEMLKEGVVLIDAGTSESDGRLSGDADPACGAKCAVFTPVPGGVGPMTVAMLFKNLSLRILGSSV
jgi:methylenetetrahydrofolate dehydrogenase (NADP+)/methenyltetrahydrofolate cyclohydrolase